MQPEQKLARRCGTWLKCHRVNPSQVAAVRIAVLNNQSIAALACRLLRYFPAKELRATHLPRGLLQDLESIQNSPPAPPRPPPPSSPLSSRPSSLLRGKSVQQRSGVLHPHWVSVNHHA